MNARRVTILVFVLSLLASFGCSGGSGSGSGGGPGPTQPALACVESGVAGVNTVVMSCGGPLDDTTEQVDVVISGPAMGTTTLRGFDFDIVYNPAKLEFVPVAPYFSPLMPSALIAVAPASGLPGHLVVGIHQPGTSSDAMVGPGPHLVISLSFRRVAGATFGPTPLTFENADVTSASPPITYANGLTLEYQ